MNYKPLLDWIERHNARLLPLALALPLLLLLSMLYRPAMTLQFGQTLTLQTVPVDPTDLFRGDYVDLFYGLNQVDLSETPVEDLPDGYTEESLRGQTLYVTFKQAGNLHEVDHFTMTRPADGPYLKGVIQYAYVKDYGKPNSGLVIHADFGIDRYYIEENSGTALEEAARNGKVLVTLRVYQGYGMVRNLEIQN